MIKQVIVVRKDLNMRKGKIAAQAAHASMKVLLDRKVAYDHGILHLDVRDIDSDWLFGSFTKICVSVDSEGELLDCIKKASAAEIPCALITDSGKTEFGGVPTNTVVAIGPAQSEEIDKITGHLKLL